MLLERKSPALEGRAAPTDPPVPKPGWHRWAILAVGAVLSLLAVHGQWDVAVAAWLAGVFLLRFTRTSRVLPGFLVVWAVTAVGVAYYLFQSGLEVIGPLLGLCVPLGVAFVVPYVLDRLVTPHLVNGLLRTLVFPLAIVGAEFVIGSVTPIGTALSSLAATQHENLPLLQLASITGSYGVSFLVAWFASVANHAWEKRLSWPGVRTVALTFAGVLVLTIVGGAIRMAFFAPAGDTVRVAAVSWSRSVNDRSDAMLERFDSMRDAAKNDPVTMRKALDLVNADLLASTEREIAAGAKIVVWPEAGAAVLQQDRADLLRRVGDLATRTGAYIEVGMALFTGKPGLAAVTNEAVLVDPQGKPRWTFEKAHPVPFMDEIEPGDGTMPYADTPFGRIANAICFDADFPTLMRKAPNVDLMLVPSNDWKEYGQTHTEKATLRAVENGYSLVRTDSNGLSRVIDPQGRTLAQADFFVTNQQTAVANVPVKGTRTIYGAVGDVFAWLSIAGLAALLVGGLVAGRRATRTAA